MSESLFYPSCFQISSSWFKELAKEAKQNADLFHIGEFSRTKPTSHLIQHLSP